MIARPQGGRFPISAAPAIETPPQRAPLPGTAQARTPRVERLFRRYARFGDLAARDELVERFMPLARGLARRYRRGSEPLDDLVQVASIGLLNAIERFDPDRGREFTSYAIPTIVGELKRHYRDRCWAMKVGRGDKERVVALTRAVEDLSARDGRSPTPKALAEHTGLALEDVLSGLEVAVAARPASLDDTAPGHADAPSPLGESLGADDPALALVEIRDEIARTVAPLTPRERRVLHLRFAEDMLQTEIGAEIGVSQMQVSRILRRALECTREHASAAAPARELSA